MLSSVYLQYMGDQTHIAANMAAAITPHLKIFFCWYLSGLIR